MPPTTHYVTYGVSSKIKCIQAYFQLERFFFFNYGMNSFRLFIICGRLKKNDEKNIVDWQSVSDIGGSVYLTSKWEIWQKRTSAQLNYFPNKVYLIINKLCMHKQFSLTSKIVQSDDKFSVLFPIKFIKPAIFYLFLQRVQWHLFKKFWGKPHTREKKLRNIL